MIIFIIKFRFLSKSSSKANILRLKKPRRTHHHPNDNGSWYGLNMLLENKVVMLVV